MTRLATVLAVVALIACGSEPAEEGSPIQPAAAEGVADEPLPVLTGSNLWTVDEETSQLTFEATQGGDAFTGRFDRFDAQVNLDPADPTEASIQVAVDLGSVDAGTEERNQALPEEGWFDTARFPRATFRSTAVEQVGEGRYRAEGTLTIKGVDVPVTMPFDLAIEDGRAVADGAFDLDRSSFGIGQGRFAGPDWVGTAVTVAFHLEAEPAQ